MSKNFASWKIHLFWIFLLFQIAAIMTGVAVDSPDLKKPLFTRKEKSIKRKEEKLCLEALRSKEFILLLEDPYPECKAFLQLVDTCSYSVLLYAERLYLLAYAIESSMEKKARFLLKEARDLIKICPEERIHREIDMYLSTLKESKNLT